MTDENDNRPTDEPDDRPGAGANDRPDDQPPTERQDDRRWPTDRRTAGSAGSAGSASDDQPDMTRERARTERRDLDKERGEPVAGGAARGGPRALRPTARPLHDWSTRPRILITNDDGVESRGLLALKQALDPIGETTVVAPDTNQSAVGHQKTLMRPLRVRERTLGDGSLAYSVDGSPTDAVSLAFLGFFGHGFDLVAAGINYGANLGDDITYSGTVSAAMEAVINGCPGFAISQEYYEHPDFTLAGLAAATVARNILEHGLSRGELINVNIPAVSPEECEGFEVTRLGRRVYQDQLIERVDPRGIPYFWIGGPPPSGLAVPGTDFHAVINRRIAVTPIHLDLTGRRLLRRLKTWNWSLEPTAGQISQEAAKPPGPDRPEAQAVDEELTEERRRDRR
jgi:5'-nucleotidase